MADMAENMNELVIEEPMIIEVDPLVLEDDEKKVIQLLEPLMVKEQSVPRSGQVDVVTYVPCPSGCDITHTKDINGGSKWTGLFWFSSMDIQSFTKNRLLQGLQELYGVPTGCGNEECVASRLLALHQMEMPDAIPCLEPDCDHVVRPGDNNCSVHTDASVTAMVLMEIRKFTKGFIMASKKVHKVLTNKDELDPTGFGNELKLNFPSLHLIQAGLRAASGSGFSHGVILSLRQVLFHMETVNTGTKRVISSDFTQVLLNLVSAMTVKVPATQAVVQPQAQVLPEHKFRQRVHMIRTQMSARTDIPRTSVKTGKLHPRLHDKEPAVKLDDTKTNDSSRKRKRDDDKKGSKFSLSCTMTNESAPLGKQLIKWSDSVCSQPVTLTTLHSTGLNNKMQTQILKSWDSQGRCTTCENGHSILAGEVVYVQLSDQHSPAILPGGARCVGTFRVLNASLHDLVRFILEPAIAQIETNQQTERVDFGLITVIERCVKEEKRLVLGVTSGTGELTEGALSYSCGMDRILKWSNSKFLKVDRTKAGKPKSIIKPFFPAPALPHFESTAYTGSVTAEGIEAVSWDLRREATAWGRTLTSSNSRDGHIPTCENLYTKERSITDPMYEAIRNTSVFEYIHGAKDFTPNHVFAAVQPSKFRMGSMVTQPHPARSIVSESGLRCLRPGYMAAYTRSLIPVYLAYGE